MKTDRSYFQQHLCADPTLTDQSWQAKCCWNSRDFSGEKFFNLCSDLDFEPSLHSWNPDICFISRGISLTLLLRTFHWTLLLRKSIIYIFTSDVIWVNCQKATLRTCFGKLPLHTPHNKGLVGALPKLNVHITNPGHIVPAVQLTLRKTKFNTSPLKLSRNPKKKRKTIRGVDCWMTGWFVELVKSVFKTFESCFVT